MKDRIGSVAGNDAVGVLRVRPGIDVDGDDPRITLLDARPEELVALELPLADVCGDSSWFIRELNTLSKDASSSELGLLDVGLTIDWTLE